MRPNRCGRVWRAFAARTTPGQRRRRNLADMTRKLRLVAGLFAILVALGVGQGSASAVESAAFPYGCPYNAFCLYENPDFTGAMIRLSSCSVYTFNPSYGMSYVNNGRPGTVATFRDARGNVLKISVPPDSGLVPAATRSVATC
jgi:hypothetical protein